MTPTRWRIAVSALTLALLSCTQIVAQSGPPSGFTPRQHRPRFVAPGTPAPYWDPIHHVTVSYDTIWAGYAVTGSDFTYVQGSWIVSAVDCTKTPNTFSSEWVGIDGWSSDTVEQTGTDADCLGTNPYYYVWYEFFPFGTIVINNVSIAPGNHFSASVTYDGDNEYTVAITNDSTGESFSDEVEFNGGFGSGKPKRNSAEWIMEMDGNELSDFGVDYFGQFYTGISDGANDATDAAFSGVINDFGNDVQQAITTRNGNNKGTKTAVPTPLRPDGQSFNIAWKAE